MVDNGVLGESSVHAVAVGAVLALDVDVGLDDVALADLEAVWDLGAGLEDGEYGFVADDERFLAQVLNPDLGMGGSGTDDLDVREAESDGFDLAEDFVVGDGADGDLAG